MEIHTFLFGGGGGWVGVRCDGIHDHIFTSTYKRISSIQHSSYIYVVKPNIYNKNIDISQCPIIYTTGQIKNIQCKPYTPVLLNNWGLQCLCSYLLVHQNSASNSGSISQRNNERQTRVYHLTFFVCLFVCLGVK